MKTIGRSFNCRYSPTLTVLEYFVVGEITPKEQSEDALKPIVVLSILSEFISEINIG
jgi:hypothetical protein